MKKIVTIVGARPQFVKLAPVSRVLRRYFEEVIVNTGQHYDFKMSGIFFDELNIPKPDYDLGVGSGSHGQQTGEMLKEIEKVLLEETPVAVIVYGDTNSTIAGALAASKLHIPLIHIEAGLRSFNKKMPEEVNRVLTDHISDQLFAPTENAVQNLQNEGINKGVHNVGDVMYDTVLYNIEIAKEKHQLSEFGLSDKGYFLATIHRAENTDDPERLKAIFNSMNRLENETVVLPLHPRTVKKLQEYDLYDSVMNSDIIKIIEPVSYLEMLLLEKHSKGIITDSGGVQKEAYFAKVPCFTVRDQTEWVETVKVGWNHLINPFENDLKELIEEFNHEKEYKPLYGNGKASEKIVEHIRNFLKDDRQ